MVTNHLRLYSCIVLLNFINAASLNDGLANKLEIFPLNEKPKYIQISQLEQILHSIEQTYRTMIEKQKEDSISMSQATTDLQTINQRLQNIETQINRMEQAEIFNKHRFELFQDSYIKEGLQFDELKRKAEKGQQQTNNRMSELDSSVEKVHSTQETLLKEMRKISATQTKLVTSIEDISENFKPDWNRFQKSMNTTQQRFLDEMKDLFKNLSALTIAKDVLIPKNSTSSSNTSIGIHNDEGTIPGLFESIFGLNDKFQAMQEQIKSVKSSMTKCINLSEHMNSEFQAQKLDLGNVIGDAKKSILDELKRRNTEDMEQLSTIFKINFDILLGEQEMFKNNCNIIQSHEDRLADRAVYALERLFNYTKNNTDEVRSEIDRLIENVIEQSTNRTKEIQTIKELTDGQKNSSGKDSTKRITSPIPTPEPKMKLRKTKYHTSTSTSPPAYKVMLHQMDDPDEYDLIDDE